MKVQVYIDNYGGVCQDVRVFTDYQNANEAFKKGLLSYKSYRLSEEDAKKLPDFEEYVEWMEFSNGGALSGEELTRLGELEGNFPILSFSNAEYLDFRIEEVEFENKSFNRLKVFAQRVVDCWETLDLASAVNKLDEILKMMEDGD